MSSSLVGNHPTDYRKQKEEREWKKRQRKLEKLAKKRDKREINKSGNGSEF